MALKRLTIFLSYASEDDPFARAIGQRLSDIFRISVELTYMSQFPLGVDYRTLIDQAVDGADILLIIATGREKPSHSFTGYEVGYFSKSKKDRNFIDEKKEIERLIIPFRIFTGSTPATVDEFQGIAIEKDRFEYDVETAGKIDDNPFFKLLERINGILNKLSDIQPLSAEQQRTREEFLRQAKLFHQDVNEFMRSLPVSKEFPKPRLTLRLPKDLRAENIKIDDGVLLSCSGPTAGIFAQEQSEQPVPWTEFSKRIGSDHIALIWNDALRSLVSSTVEGNFADTGQLVFSYDEKKAFRLFLSESRRYYDRTRQLDVYLVEILHDKDVGNPVTTFLAKTIAVHMGYRSRFLEIGGPYNHAAVSYWTKEEWKQKINQLLRDLRVLYTQSREAGVFDERWITELYGKDPKTIENVKRMMNETSEQLKKLNSAAAKVLAESEPTQAEFDAFAQTLDEFRAKAKARDTPFLARILEHLKRVVEQD